MQTQYNKIISINSTGPLTNEQVLQAMIGHLNHELGLENGTKLPVVKAAIDKLFSNQKQV
jgi:hypothetical protein